jgi:hypothetical protein
MSKIERWTVFNDGPAKPASVSCLGQQSIVAQLRESTRKYAITRYEGSSEATIIVRLRHSSLRLANSRSEIALRYGGG